MTWLYSSWMDNPTFLAEMAHFAWAYGILLTGGLFCIEAKGLVRLFLAFIAFAVVKEYWYDLAYELPPDSVAGSTLDFAVYLAGGLIALAVIWMRNRWILARWEKNIGQRMYFLSDSDKKYILCRKLGVDRLNPNGLKVFTPEELD